MISIVACCHGAKLCAHAARDFRSQQNGAVTRIGTKRGEVSHVRRSGRLLKPQLRCALHFVYCASACILFVFWRAADLLIVRSARLLLDSRWLSTDIALLC